MIQRLITIGCIESDAIVANHAEDTVTGDEFVSEAQDAGLTERQAVAFFNRRVANVPRHETAETLGTSASNIDNLERAARDKIVKAHKLVELVQAVDVDPGEL